MVKFLLIGIVTMSAWHVISPAESLAETEAEGNRPATLLLEKAVVFSDQAGTLLSVPSGSYRLSADQPNHIQLRSLPEGTTFSINTSAINHQEGLNTPAARLMAGESDALSIVLLLPDGKGYVAEGSLTGVQSRQIVPAAAPLRVGDSRRVRVVARTFVNWTGITFMAGQRYRFEVVSDPPFENGLWVDSGVRTTADGFSTCPIDALCAPFRALRRIPDANWFVLSGGIGDSSPLAGDLRHRFPIGDRRTVTAPSTGHLGLFANDVATMYWNNEGAITMAITRIE